MNKKILIFIWASILPIMAFSKNLPDTLLINNTQQLLLKFPTTIQYVDLGTNDIVGKTWFQKTCLSLNTNNTEMESTTISVVTSEGNYYSYVLKFSEDLDVLAYNINEGKIESKEAEVSNSKTTHFIANEDIVDIVVGNDSIIADSALGIKNIVKIKSLSKKIKVTAKPIYNDNIVAYMVTKGCTLDTPGLNANLLIATRYDEHGCYLRKDDFVTRLPSFSAGQYTNNVKSWTNTIYGASGDDAEHYWADVKSGKLNDFLFKNLLWCCMTQYTHMVSQYGSDGRLYLNQICLDGDTLARKYLDKYIEDGYEPTDKENELFELYEKLMREVANGKEEYNPDFTYGIYQIEKEIDTTYHDAKGNCCHNYGDLQSKLKNIKAKAKDYYVKEIAPVLMKYELVK
jgi:hypothetical protein